MIKHILLLLLLNQVSFAQQKFDVFFDFNKEVPNAKSTVELNKWIDQNSNSEITAFYGFADSTDANLYTKELSARRIRSVRNIMIANNIAIISDAVEKSFGEDFTPSAVIELNRKVTLLYRQPDQLSKGSESSTNDSIATPVAELFRNKRQGDVIRIENIHFYRNKEEIIPESEPILEELFEVMSKNPKLGIEIHGHICCNSNSNDTRLSYRRAKFIFTFLLNKGIALNRLAYKGFGSARRIYAIPEQNHYQQLANRRVEILIVRN